jgi:hypothetical protein
MHTRGLPYLAGSVTHGGDSPGSGYRNVNVMPDEFRKINPWRVQPGQNPLIESSSS